MSALIQVILLIGGSGAVVGNSQAVSVGAAPTMCHEYRNFFFLKKNFKHQNKAKNKENYPWKKQKNRKKQTYFSKVQQAEPSLNSLSCLNCLNFFFHRDVRECQKFKELREF